MKFTPKSILFTLLKCGQNVRLATNLKIAELAEDIRTVGLQNPIQIWKPEASKDDYEVLRGHRRAAAIGQIAKQDAKRFDELFGKGVPCMVISDITASEALELKVDHGNELSLTDPFEVQLCANLLFAAGKGEKDVVASLAGLMDRIAPMRGKNRKELDALEAAVVVADSSGDKLLAEAKRQEALNYTFNYRRGLVQGMHNAYRCPSIVMAALAQKAGGVVPEEYSKEYLPDVTQNDVKALWKAHAEDMTILENGKPKFNADRPGPAFRAQWDKLIAKSKQAEAEGEDTPRPKSMSANDIMADVKEGKFKSEIACKMAAYHAGDKSYLEDITKLDADSYAADLVKAHNTELWATVTKEANQIAVRIRESDKAATVTK